MFQYQTVAFAGLVLRLCKNLVSDDIFFGLLLGDESYSLSTLLWKIAIFVYKILY